MHLDAGKSFARETNPLDSFGRAKLLLERVLEAEMQLQYRMKRQRPVVSRILQQRDQMRDNQRLLTNLVALKFSNISSIRGHHHPSSDKPSPAKVITSDLRPHRIKTINSKQKIEHDNRYLYSRLTHQKSTISTKHMAEERLKQLEHLKRISKFPFPRSSLATEPSPSPKAEFNNSRRRQPHLETSHSQPSRAMKVHYIDQDPPSKEHLIVLFSKVLQLSKGWFTVKLLRFKSHYQISLTSYPHPKIEHSLLLPELVGTALLSQTDYDYLFICHKCLKFTTQHLCLSFELGNDRKKHFYRFEQKVNPSEGSQGSLPLKEKEGGKEHRHSRKTVFAMEDSKIEAEESARRERGEEEETASFDFNRLNTFESINIKLSSPDQYLK